MTDKEHRDIYIAFAVGGVVFVLGMLYVHGGSQAATVAMDASGAPLPSAGTSVDQPALTPYNFNIEPYNPSPGIVFPANNLPANNGANGCCNSCGPQTGGQYFNSTVAQFQTLIGPGG